ncbi:E3 ubiquitin-protein ligase MARCH5 isoform X1 [Harpegnathos saltator]|uniref:E3 ubiquitin-protein ligase MARCH5 isoform X1 n=1 Tax=Harpegnathos saltator TaxID=610380 RepID=UPI00058EB3E6|nr:E3 ubiquitin-protein ligase MARCH5 isoform X1 [Harpegnathos saltator]XP_011149924.1 E3 ubiquitin-protein ligase MARCH5 isoform X1 [Harpegnathos saltator]XP_025158504.1 E3 ubiquitin-protein ligase MARCH5 isoform X1 [Harpegnathos saltator]XP_025158505.1 E3 ubiquitin-protein ligase MARCH5 isoform X1 [Harpegnathos saltator]XP_025158507.1 E3 ubiquitin-protein ligase MARCH5 isoform X1 [Harpegnathos saltator]XP_025158508.1 E3 ubiquitin-protein ligase MARCH5 isoform X1 [Harpegnathos saltator]XP_02
MSEDNLPHISYGLDSRGRIVRIESGITRANIRRLPSIEEALRRFSTNLRVDRQVNDSNDVSYISQYLSVIYFRNVSYILLIPMSYILPGTSDFQAQVVSSEEEISQNISEDITDRELSIDITDGVSSPNYTTSSMRSLSMDEDKRYCWVCFATDEDDATAAWVKPCHCRGTTKWVHQGCIQRWVDEKQKGHAEHAVACPQCNTEYIIVYPNMGPLVVILDTIDTVIFRVCPFIAAGIVVGSIYWTAVTYGAVTVMQVVGHKDGLTMMEQADPLVLLVGLPTIPIMLVLGKMLRWEDQALGFLRRHACKVPILRHFLPSSYSSEDTVQSEDIPPMNDPVSATRVLCGALLLPTIASICGKLFFESISSNFQRTLLGGAAFLTIKGAFKIYHKQQQYMRQCQRRVMDYTESNVALYKRQQNSESDQTS